MIEKYKDKIIRIMVEELGYDSSEMAESVLGDRDYSPELEDTIKQWVEDRTVSDFEVNGYSIKDFLKIRRENFVLALKVFSTLLEESEEDKNRMIEYLKKPPIIM